VPRASADAGDARSRPAGPSDEGGAQREIEAGERFAFGANWTRFLALVDEGRVATAAHSLRRLLGTERLDGKRLLDAGSGSGLFSLAARSLGAEVLSFDYDAASVACARALRDRFTPGDDGWRIERGSVLDSAFLAAQGTFDVVYSWGVLHHTGAMWDALRNVAGAVAPSGKLCLAIYNEQGRRSQLWRAVKRAYCSGVVGRSAVSATFIPLFAAEALLVDLVHKRNPLARYSTLDERGMSALTDWIDWLGGYPYETARPEEIFAFCRSRGFTLELLTTGGFGCNQFVFSRTG
jgi:2-polyprenyl-6-hydroxyphenyl methylase/3-demethylubiquinone-9 3-methyltransferase